MDVSRIKAKSLTARICNIKTYKKTITQIFWIHYYRNQSQKL